MSPRPAWTSALMAAAACLVGAMAAQAEPDPKKPVTRRPQLERHDAEAPEEFGEHLEATSRAAALKANSALAAARAKRNNANADHNVILQEYERSVTEAFKSPTETNKNAVVANKYLLKDSYNKALKAQEEVNDAKETLADSEQNLINVQKRRNAKRGRAIDSNLHQLSPETVAYLNQVENQRAAKGAQLPRVSKVATAIDDRRIFQRLPGQLGAAPTATATATKAPIRQQIGQLPQDPASQATNSTATNSGVVTGQRTAVRQQNYGQLVPETGSGATNSTAPNSGVVTGQRTAVRQQNYGQLVPETGSGATNSTATNSGVVTGQRTAVRQQNYGQLVPETGSGATNSTSMNGPGGQVNQAAVIAIATQVPPPPGAPGGAAAAPRAQYTPAPARLQQRYDTGPMK